LSYYEDELSKWYVSANNKHSTFVNQIKDADLKAQVESVADTKKFDSTFDTRFEFQVKDNTEKFSVWVDADPSKNKLYRLSPGENSSSPKPSTGSSFSSGSNFKPPAGERGWFDSKSHDLVTLEEYKEQSAKDFSIRPLTAKEKTPNNYCIIENGKKQVYLWIGKWMKPNN